MVILLLPVRKPTAFVAARFAEPLKGASLIGNGAMALLKIEGVGNDFALDPGIGSCGKNGQWVPVGVGQPSMLISSLTVGGDCVWLEAIWATAGQAETRLKLWRVARL